MTVKLYVFPLSPRSFKVLWAANHAGVDFEMKLVDFTKNAQNAPEYVALNPNAKAPVLEHDGFVLWESNAIVAYIASLKPESGLLPADTRGRLSIEKWLFWESAHWDPACVPFAFERVVKALFNRGAEDPKEIERGNHLFARVGPVLDGELSKHRYIAGDKVTAADIAIGASMCIAEQARFPMESFRNIQRWHEDLKALPSWKKARALQMPPGANAAQIR